MPNIISNGAPTAPTHIELATTAAKAFGSADGKATDSIRKMLDNLLRASVLDNFALEPLIEGVKSAMEYPKRSKQAQATFRKAAQDLRTVAGRYPGLPDTVKADFASRKVLFPALLSDIKARIKGEEEAGKATAEAEAAQAEAARLAEAGFETPEAEAEAQAIIDAKRLDVLAIERVLAMIEAGDMPDEMALLIDAVNALQTSTVQDAIAA